MKPKDSKYRNKLSIVRDTKDALAKKCGEVRTRTLDKIQDIDSELSIRERTRKFVDTSKKFIHDAELDTAGRNLSDAGKQLGKRGYDLAKSRAIELDKKSGASKAITTFANSVDKVIVAPTKAAISKTNLSYSASCIKQKLEAEYGEIRAGLKTYPDPESIEEQLQYTRRTLVNVTSCVLQMNNADAENWLGSFGKVVTAKVSGVVVSGALLGLVSTFGTAGTGTAIASLSGAASTSATLAWVGSWVGGGMAAGAFLTAGIGLLAGIAAFKLFRSEVRQYENLKDNDKALVETVGMLVTAIDDALSKKPVRFTKNEADALIEEALIPLYEVMLKNAEDICSRLDAAHSLKYREHLLWDFEPVVIDGFKKIKAILPIDLNAVVGGVFYALLSRTAIEDSFEQKVVMDAIRRSKIEFEEASEAAISDYLSQLSPIQLKGYASNVKGIAHELMFVEKYNHANKETFARVMEHTNHPGEDIEIVNAETGEVLRRIQMKAVSSRGPIDAHNDKYSDMHIEILTTEEIASKYDDIQGSGISNIEITQRTESVMEDLANNTIFDRSIESGEIAGLVTFGKEAISVLQGRSDAPLAIKRAISSTTQTIAATAITAYLFS